MPTRHFRPRSKWWSACGGSSAEPRPAKHQFVNGQQSGKRDQGAEQNIGEEVPAGRERAVVLTSAASVPPVNVGLRAAKLDYAARPRTAPIVFQDDVDKHSRSQQQADREEHRRARGTLGSRHREKGRSASAANAAQVSMATAP